MKSKDDVCGRCHKRRGAHRASDDRCPGVALNDYDASPTWTFMERQHESVCRELSGDSLDDAGLDDLDASLDLTDRALKLCDRLVAENARLERLLKSPSKFLFTEYRGHVTERELDEETIAELRRANATAKTAYAVGYGPPLDEKPVTLVDEFVVDERCPICDEQMSHGSLHRDEDCMFCGSVFVCQGCEIMIPGEDVDDRSVWCDGTPVERVERAKPVERALRQNHGVIWGVVERDDRVDVSFYDKPDVVTLSKLRANGFRYTPSTKTWSASRDKYDVALEIALRATLAPRVLRHS